MHLVVILLTSLAVPIALAQVQGSGGVKPLHATIVDHAPRTVVSTSNASTLSTIAAPGYDLINVLELRGNSSFQIGYDMGVLTGKHQIDLYNAFVGKRIPAAKLKQFEACIDAIWSEEMASFVPPRFADELKGIGAGGADAGMPTLGTIATRILMMGNQRKGREGQTLIESEEREQVGGAERGAQPMHRHSTYTAHT